MRDRGAEADAPHGDELDGGQVEIIRRQSAAGRHSAGGSWEAGGLGGVPHPPALSRSGLFLKVKYPSHGRPGQVLGSQILLLSSETEWNWNKMSYGGWQTAFRCITASA